MTGVNRRLESVVRGEMRRLRRRPERSRAHSHWPPAVARSAHHRRRVLAPIDRVAAAVPVLRRPVAWLQEARAALVDRLAGKGPLADPLSTPRIPSELEVPR
jgi:hypothetical protein